MLARMVLPPVLVTIVLAVIGAFSLLVEQAWLVPSITAAAFLQVFSPDQTSAKPYAIAVGQIIGGAAGFVGVLVTASSGSPAFTGDHHLGAGRLAAIVIATALTSALQSAAKATSPAGAATAVIVATGVETTTWLGAGRLLVGIALVTILGEIARRLVLRIR